MYLVPEEVMTLIRQQNDIQTSPLVKSMSSLSQKMSNTLYICAVMAACLFKLLCNFLWIFLILTYSEGEFHNLKQCNHIFNGLESK